MRLTIAATIICLLLLEQLTYAQNQSYTFHVESLSKPSKSLPEKTANNAFSDIFNAYRISKSKNVNISPIDPKFILRSPINASLVNFDVHSFYEGMLQAYAEHRPFTLTPDMIWLLVSQGFAQHVLNYSEKLRHYFVQHQGKASLIVESKNKNDLSDISFWEKAMQNFNQQIGQYTGNELIDNLTNNFSTTTSASKVASQISIMEGMQAYFEYVVMYVGCGIPDITLEGTPKDWGNLKMKANALRKYELGWWIDELDPALSEFINASQHKINISFWKKMFKHHEGAGYKPGISDGWIVKFFPYDRYGKRNNLQAISSSGQLPSEVVKVPIRYIETFSNGRTQESKLELWAGFLGLQQDKKTFGLKPEIGWLVRKVEDNEDLSAIMLNDIKQKVEQSNSKGQISGALNLRVDKFPEQLLQVPKINFLTINFIDSVNLPDNIGTIQIKHLSMFGKYNKNIIDRIKNLLGTNTAWTIGNQPYHELLKETERTLDDRIKSQNESLQMIKDLSGFDFTLPKDYRETLAEKTVQNYELGLPGLVQYENGKYILQFPNGVYSHEGDLLDGMHKMIQEGADNDFPIKQLPLNLLSKIGADSGYIFNLNIKLTPTNNGYAYCKAVCLYNARPTLIRLYFFYKNEDDTDIDKEIERCLSSFKIEK